MWERIKKGKRCHHFIQQNICYEKIISGPEKLFCCWRGYFETPNLGHKKNVRVVSYVLWIIFICTYHPNKRCFCLCPFDQFTLMNTIERMNTQFERKICIVSDYFSMIVSALKEVYHLYHVCMYIWWKKKTDCIYLLYLPNRTDIFSDKL